MNKWGMGSLLVSFFMTAFAHAAPITTAAEQREFVEALSGVSHLGVGGLPSVISQRYSDSSEIFTAAEFLKAKYAANGIDATILEYDPLDAYPYYFHDIDETYRSYFQRMIPAFRDEFNGLCDGTLPADKRETVLKRLARVGLTEQRLCAAAPADRVETYIHTTVAFSTAGTKRMLEQRKLATWPNVLAIVPTSESAGEAGARPLCVIGAHMDSVARDGGGRGPIVSPATLAPGADDNGSGTAAVFTLARAARTWVKAAKPALPCDLAFVHFSGEEEGLLGSIMFAHKQAPRPMLWMVNFDMIAYNKSPTPAVNIGYSASFGRELADAFTSSSPVLKVVVVEKDTFIYSSDQISFWNAGVPAISVSEQACSDEKCANSYAEFNPNLHTPQDTVEKLDFEYAANIVNYSFASLTKLLATYKLR